MTAQNLAAAYLKGAQTPERLQKLKACCARFSVPYEDVERLLQVKSEQ